MEACIRGNFARGTVPKMQNWGFMSDHMEATGQVLQPQNSVASNHSELEMQYYVWFISSALQRMHGIVSNLCPRDSSLAILEKSRVQWEVNPKVCLLSSRISGN